MQKFVISIPRRLRQVAIDTLSQMREAQLLLTASSLAYITILSLVPLLAISFAVFQAFGGLDKLYERVQPLILDNLAEGTSDQVTASIEGFIRNIHSTTVGVGGFLGLIFTSMSMLANIESAFNRIWKTANSRSLFQKFSTYWLFITLGPLALSITVGLATSTHLSLVTHLVPQWVVMFLVSVFALFGIYKAVPNCRVDWKFSLLAAAVTTLGFNLTRVIFNIYIRQFASYNRIYGSVAAVPILLFWIYIVWVILLAGASLNAALQKRLESLEEAKQDLRYRRLARAQAALNRPVSNNLTTKLTTKFTTDDKRDDPV